MNLNAFYARREKELAELPEEFRGVVSRYAWEHGHSAGYDQALYYVRDLVGNLKEPCQKYAERIRKEAKGNPVRYQEFKRQEKEILKDLKNQPERVSAWVAQMAWFYGATGYDPSDDYEKILELEKDFIMLINGEKPWLS